MEDDWLETLITQEAAYFRFAADLEQTPAAWFLTNPGLPDYRDANRALRLRDVGDGPDFVAQFAIARFRSLGLPPVADVDAVAEAQGIGAALRRRGVTPVVGNTLLMRREAQSETDPAPQSEAELQIEIVPNETGAGEAREWIATVERGFGEDDPYWHGIIEREARYSACRLYLATWSGRNAGACDLFVLGEWARLDSVGTLPEFRRRGVASALVRRAIADAENGGVRVLYLFTEAGSDAERLYRKCGFIPWKLNPLRRHAAS